MQETQGVYYQWKQQDPEMLDVFMKAAVVNANQCTGQHMAAFQEEARQQSNCGKWCHLPVR